jgi:conserved oligomeric Golgi complex subunit 6
LQSEAGADHAVELQKLRAQSQETMDQIRAAHDNTIQEHQAAHEEVLSTSSKSLEKKLNSAGLELRATRDDLAKAKANLTAAQNEVAALSVQVNQLKETLTAVRVATSSDAGRAAEVEKLKGEVFSLNDELTMIKGAFQATKESFAEISASHERELEEKTKLHVEQTQKLRAELEEERSLFERLRNKLESELEDERVAKERAKAEALAAQTALQTPPMSPKPNGNAPTPMVLREELQKLHEAHSAKVSELEADHQKALQGLEEQLRAMMENYEGANTALHSKTLELQFTETEKQDLESELARLQAEAGQS